MSESKIVAMDESRRRPARSKLTLRLATSIADGRGLDSGDISSLNGCDPDTKNGLIWVDRIAKQFRHADNMLGAQTPPPAFRFAGLDVYDKIGEGSYAEVYRAHDPSLRQDVALKLGKLERGLMSAAFLEEARTLAQLRHPNILSVYGASIENGRPGIWSELLGGRSLRDVLTVDGVLSVDEIRRIGIEMCHALACIHRHGWIHGDVKPENIVRDDFGRTVLTDFGSARAFSGDASAPVRASVRYLAPEVARGGSVTAACDIYALGVTLFQLACGTFPYALDDAETSASALAQPVARLRVYRSGLPKDICAAIEQAIEPDPSRRHRSALALAAALAPSQGTRIRRGVIGAGLAAAVCAAAFAANAWFAPPTWVNNVAFYRSTVLGYQPLNSGDELRAGQALSLHFSSTRATYLYVVDDDGSEHPTLLFPSKDLQLRNPLTANAPTHLPGVTSDGQEHDWQIDDAQRVDHVVVFASEERLEGLEAAIAELGNPAASGSAPDTTNLRGMQTLTPAQADHGALSRIIATQEPLRARGKLQYWEFLFPHAPSSP